MLFTRFRVKCVRCGGVYKALHRLRGRLLPLVADIYPRSPGNHIVGSWVIDSISLYREPGTGTQYIGNWASRVYIYIYIYAAELWI